tara:strand:- start:7162 stop:7584 length:423 start_codon:yes stop_codon:yes gene_type:complete
MSKNKPRYKKGGLFGRNTNKLVRAKTTPTPPKAVSVFESEKTNELAQNVDENSKTRSDITKTAFGSLSVKAGIDNNHNPTQADRIAGATNSGLNRSSLLNDMCGGGIFGNKCVNKKLQKEARKQQKKKQKKAKKRIKSGG